MLLTWASMWLMHGIAHAQERCSQSGVEFIVGGAGERSASACASRLQGAETAVSERSKSARGTAVAPESSKERRHILEQELFSEQARADAVRSELKDKPAPGLQHEQMLKRHEGNIEALRREIARLP